MNTQPDLETFAAKLLEEKGMAGLDEEVQVQLAKDLVDRLENRVNAAIIAAMPQDKMAGFNEVLEKGDTAAIQAYCEAAIPNSAEVIATELMGFRDTYLQG